MVVAEVGFLELERFFVKVERLLRAAGGAERARLFMLESVSGSLEPRCSV